MGKKEECPLASVGTIMLRVYTSRAQLPVPGATVAVTQKRGGGLEGPLSGTQSEVERLVYQLVHVRRDAVKAKRGYIA